MSIPSVLNSKIYHGLSAMKKSLPEFQRLDKSFRNKRVTKMSLLKELDGFAHDYSVDIDKNIVTKRGKFSPKGKELLKRMLEHFNLGTSATWDDLFKRASEYKKLEYSTYA